MAEFLTRVPVLAGGVSLDPSDVPVPSGAAGGVASSPLGAAASSLGAAAGGVASGSAVPDVSPLLELEEF